MASGMPLSMALTEFHFMLLYRDRIIGISNLNEQLTYEEQLPLVHIVHCACSLQFPLTYIAETQRRDPRHDCRPCAQDLLGIHGPIPVRTRSHERAPGRVEDLPREGKVRLGSSVHYSPSSPLFILSSD